MTIREPENRPSDRDGQLDASERTAPSPPAPKATRGGGDSVPAGASVGGRGGRRSPTERKEGAGGDTAKPRRSRAPKPKSLPGSVAGGSSDGPGTAPQSPMASGEPADRSVADDRGVVPTIRAAPPALSVAKLSFAYKDRKVLDDVSFRVERGIFTALLGPNGAGKTTLFSLITRLFDSGDGAIRILGKDPKIDGAKALAPLGVVFQRETLDLDLTVRQNLHYFAALHGLRSREAERRMEEELAAIDVLDKIGTRVRDLNGGHRRRVEIARALLHRPDLLLLDEATVGLDVPSRRAIVARVHALARERDIGVLWTTHLIDEVLDDDALLVLHRGCIVAAGRVADVVAGTGEPSLSAAFDHLTGQKTGDGETSR